MRAPSVCRVVILAFVCAVAGCSTRTVQWTGPGWYLQKPHLVTFGTDRFAGPYPTFDLCEDARTHLALSDQFLCLQEIRKPGFMGGPQQ
jgi:hypothetical protein